MDSKVEQAREWAKGISYHPCSYEPEEVEAARIILNLPDTVVDGDKLREVISKVLANTIHGTVGHQVAEDYAALIGELIPTPPLATLADMAPEEREACQWMQADVKLYGEGSVTCVIADPRRPGAKVRVWASHGGSDDVEEGRVTPLPDLPKLEWPGSHADTITTESVEDMQAGRVADFEPVLPCPEDVPAGEPWIVLCGGKEWIGVRAKDHDFIPWSIVRMDGLDNHDVSDSKISLVSRLVPENKENA